MVATFDPYTEHFFCLLQLFTSYSSHLFQHELAFMTKLSLTGFSLFLINLMADWFVSNKQLIEKIISPTHIIFPILSLFSNWKLLCFFYQYWHFSSKQSITCKKQQWTEDRARCERRQPNILRIGFHRRNNL